MAPAITLTKVGRCGGQVNSQLQLNQREKSEILEELESSTPSAAEEVISSQGFGERRESLHGRGGRRPCFEEAGGFGGSSGGGKKGHA